MILVNGKQSGSIPVSDRGFQYGDGIFETIEVRNRYPIFLAQHLRRLTAGCQTLKIPAPDEELLKKECLLISEHASSSVLKLIISRGVGGRGYRTPQTVITNRVISLHDYPIYPQSYDQEGINLRFCDTELGINPALAGIKHLNRLEQVMARSEWQDNDIQEGLMSNYQQHVIEGTMSNVFIVKSDHLITPVIDQCGVNGIIRDQILSLAEIHHIPYSIAPLTRQEILQADEVFVTNSIIGLWPVKQLQQRHYQVGNFTRRLKSLLKQRQDEDLSSYEV